MKHAITRLIRTRPTVAMLAAMGMLWMGSTQRLHAQTERSDGGESSRSVACSAAAVAGEWAYTETGSVIPSSVAVPFAAVARYTLDAGGDLSGTATSSSGGTVANVTLKGTGTVNPDCTGTLTVGVYASGNLVRTATFDVVYVDGTREARAIICIVGTRQWNNRAVRADRRREEGIRTSTERALRRPKCLAIGKGPV